MSTLAERFSEALASAKEKAPYKNKAGLGRACGVTASSVTDWFSGRVKSLNFEVAGKAAAYLNVNARWLASGIGECAAGERCAVYFEELKDSVKARYRRSWFQARQINPDNCRRFKVHGTSMEPFIWDGDTILVDCTPQQIMGGKTYAFMLHGDMRVKMLYPLMKGQLLVKSLNPDVPDETLGDEDLDTFELIGRVRDRSGDGKL